MNNLIKMQPKIWQYWVPNFPGFDYKLYYIPKNLRDSYRNSNYAFKIFYPNKGYFLFLIPNGLLPGISKKKLSFSVSIKNERFKLKPFLTAFYINLLGLTFRFKIFLRVKGLGYKAYVYNSGKLLSLKLGFSHIINFKFSRDMFATKLGQKDRMFSIEGSNWIILTNTVSRIQNLRKIDYYRGKGIFKKFFNCKIRQNRKKKK